MGARLIGPASAPGGGGAGGEVAYIHQQSTPSDVWLIQHNLGFCPNITVLDSAGSIVEGEISYQSHDECTLTFQAGFSGYAFLS